MKIQRIVAVIGALLTSGCIIPVGAIETQLTRPEGGAPRFAQCSAPAGLPEQIAQFSNAQRTSAGRAALEADQRLGFAAQQHACDLARRRRPPSDLMRRDLWDPHLSNNGATIRHRTDDAGFGKCRVDENLATGQRRAEDIVRDWLGSSSHAQQLLDRGMRKQGIGVARDVNGNLWVVAKYGANC